MTYIRSEAMILREDADLEGRIERGLDEIVSMYESMTGDTYTEEDRQALREEVRRQLLSEG